MSSQPQICLKSSTVSVYDSSAPPALLKALARFYRDTPGADRLLTRAQHAHRFVQDGTAEAALGLNPAGIIIAAALLFHHTSHLTEIASVLVSSEGSGLYSYLRQRLAHRAGELGKTVTLFERLPDKDPVKWDYERARRLAEGWQIMNCEHPDYRLVERTKADMPPSNGGHPPKIGFRQAAKPGPISPFAYREMDEFDVFPFRNPAFSLGR